jgi:hypothetical protein
VTLHLGRNFLPDETCLDPGLHAQHGFVMTPLFFLERIAPVTPTEVGVHVTSKSIATFQGAIARVIRSSNAEACMDPGLRRDDVR